MLAIADQTAGPNGLKVFKRITIGGDIDFDIKVVRNLAFNYILADHEDAEVVAFNRTMLPIYYGILR